MPASPRRTRARRSSTGARTRRWCSNNVFRELQGATKGRDADRTRRVVADFIIRNMSVFALGLNHNTAPVDLRGRFAFSPEQLAPTLQAFRQRLQRVSEVAIVSTCNRTELYVGASPGLVSPAVDWLAGVGGVSSSVLRD